MRILIILPFLLAAVFSWGQEEDSPTLGNTIVSVMPMYTYGSDNVSDVGVGAAYERMFSDVIALRVPIAIGLNHEMIQTGIGVKIYPGGHDGIITYAVAPTFLYTHALSNDNVYYYDGFYETYVSSDTEVDQVGFMLANSVNITVGEHIHLGLEAGIGINYFNNFKGGNDYPGREDPSVSGNFGLALGYRF